MARLAARTGSTGRMVRRMMTTVAWLALSQPTVLPGPVLPGPVLPGPVLPGPVVFAALTVPGDAVAHPATAVHSSPATTIPRSWRGVIMLL